MTAERDDDTASDPLLRAWLLGIAAVGPLFIAVALGVSMFDENGGDTAPVFLAIFAMPFLVSGAIVNVFAGILLSRSDLFHWAARNPPVAPAIVIAALVLVSPAFLDASSGGDGVSLPLLLLSATELSIALTWLAAMRIGLAIAATVGLALALLAAAGSVD